MAMKFDADLVADCIARRDAAGLSRWLMSGTQHGKPGAPQAIKVAVIGAIREQCSEAQRLAFAKRLMKREEPVARSVSCSLIADGWTRDPVGTRGRLRQLAEDPDWEVREWAAEALGDLLGRDFGPVLELYRSWIAEHSEALQRAVALALAARSRARVRAEARPMLALMESLLPLPGAYLQKNLGPFALGGAFLSRFPDETLALLRRVSRGRDETLRWNVAMAFTSAAARKHREAGREILSRLEDDDRKRVVSAVARARKNLAR